MSLFGGSKFGTASAPAFGASTSAFSFGAGASSAGKPIFGSTATTQPSLFGGPATTSTLQQPSLFGTPVTTSLQQPGTFGASKPGSTAFSTGFLSSGPKPSGLLGAQTTASQVSTVQDLIQNTDSLIRSLTAPDLYGDDRDRIIACFNQLLAACGIGGGYYKSDQQPVVYSSENPFYQFKAIGYSRRSDYCDSDGIVALTMGVNYEQLSTAAQRQKFIDAMNVVLGNNTNVRAHIELIRPLPDNQTEVLIYATEKGRGRPSSKELCAYLKQPTQEGQLRSQLCVVNILTRTAMNEAKKSTFIKNPPAGFDAQVWQQAVQENPDSEKLLPYPIRGFEQLRKRQDMQTAEIHLEERVTEELKRRLVLINDELTNGQNHCSSQRQKQKELSHRLLRCLAMQSLLQQYTVSIDGGEEKLETRLEALNAFLIAPNQIKSRVTNLLSVLRDEAETLKAADKAPLKLTEKDAAQIKKYLSRAQEALEATVDVVRENADDLNVIETHLK